MAGLHFRMAPTTGATVVGPQPLYGAFRHTEDHGILSNIPMHTIEGAVSWNSHICSLPAPPPDQAAAVFEQLRAEQDTQVLGPLQTKCHIDTKYGTDKLRYNRWWHSLPQRIRDMDKAATSLLILSFALLSPCMLLGPRQEIAFACKRSAT